MCWAGYQTTKNNKSKCPVATEFTVLGLCSILTAVTVLTENIFFCDLRHVINSNISIRMNEFKAKVSAVIS